MERWHITVREPDDVARPFERRFTFDNATEAAYCYAKAKRAGFLVLARQVSGRAHEMVGGK